MSDAAALIPSSHLRISPWPDRAAGGQHVGTATGVRVEHLPSGLVACVNIERSQLRNREIAVEMILGGLTCRAYRR